MNDFELDPHALTLFVDIVEAGNLSAAARSKKMSRANISYHLSQLEKGIGQQLMRRTTRQVELTEVGHRLYQHGCVVRNELQAARESIATFGQAVQGRIRLSMPTGFGHLVMSQWLIEFKRLHPSIALELLFDNRVDDLIREEVDLVVRVMSEPPQQMVAIELGQVRYVVCASSDFARAHPLPAKLDDLSSVPLITSVATGRELRVAAYQGDARQELLLSPNLASENFQFLREAILAGLGVGLVPDYVVEREVASGQVVTVLDDLHLSIFGNRMFLLRMPGRYQTAAARTLIDFIVAKARVWAR